MPWVILFIAGLFEVVWATGLKYSEGFTRPGPSLVTVAALIVSMALLGLAAKTLPLGTAYAVWTGIGAVGATLCGILLFGEPATLLRMLFLGCIIIGILGLRFT